MWEFTCCFKAVVRCSICVHNTRKKGLNSVMHGNQILEMPESVFAPETLAHSFSQETDIILCDLPDWHS